MLFQLSRSRVLGSLSRRSVGHLAPERRTTTAPNHALPGFGKPLNFEPEQLLPSAHRPWSVKLSLITRREQTMQEFMNAITNKKDWYDKVENESVVAKWRREALASPQGMTERMVDWCIAELQDKAQAFRNSDNPPPIMVCDGPVYKSDTAVPEDLRQAFVDAVKAFEANIAPEGLDWHPRSNNKVLDLVHPSLFPVVFGRTRILLNETTTLEDCITRCGDGTTLDVPPDCQTSYTDGDPNGYDPFSMTPREPYSSKFQWLPCDVDLKSGNARITSYINNLHPTEERSMYRLIERLIDTAIPLWDRNLISNYDFDDRVPPRRIVFDEVIYDPDPDNWPETEGPQQLPGEPENTYWDRRFEWIRKTRRIVLPNPPETYTPLPSLPPLDLKNLYASTGLQVIVKLANIHLDPTKPSYDGGSWHIEGQMNEHIVASALFYYDSHNITPSWLAFRHSVASSGYVANDTIRYDAHLDHEWVEEVFGCKHDSAVQPNGRVDTPQGRLISFPNTVQHRLEPFQLEDPTKPGHRKLVALFLVDPNVKIISSAHVPCQKRDWWLKQTRASGESVASKDDQYPMDMKEAKALRLELMDERSVKQGDLTAYIESRDFSLCEH